MVEKKDVQGGNTELNFVYTVKSDKTQAIPLESCLPLRLRWEMQCEWAVPCEQQLQRVLGAVRVQAAPVVVEAAAAAAARVADNG
jgi:hypothetical protein